MMNKKHLVQACLALAVSMAFIPASFANAFLRVAMRYASMPSRCHTETRNGTRRSKHKIGLERCELRTAVSRQNNAQTKLRFGHRTADFLNRRKHHRPFKPQISRIRHGNGDDGIRVLRLCARAGENHRRLRDGS